MSSSVQYKHRPLRHPDAIRLCRVLPQSDTASPIQISLSSYRLSDPKLNFTALSYTWGDESDKIPISVGGAFFSVPRSSVEALTVLRLNKKRQLFWVDAICIDQDNTQEKSVQVRMMARIFSKASCTTIYLGPHTESSKIVFQEVLEALHGPKAMDPYGRITPDRATPNDNVIRGLEELFQRPWFRRVWVLQEVHMGRDVQVLCGDSLVPKHALLDCIYGYRGGRITKTAIPFAFSTSNMQPELSPSHILWDRLWKCFYWTRDSLATNPRDRLFALRAFLGPPETIDDDPYMVDFERLIDYGETLEEILERLALIFIRFIGLRLLTGVKHGHHPKMPSWVPDWSQNLPLCYTFFAGHAYEERRTQSIDPVASRKYHLQDPHLLSVQGWRRGQIHEMGKTFWFDNLKNTQHGVSRIASVIAGQDFKETIQTGISEIIEAGLTPSNLKVFRQVENEENWHFLDRGLGGFPSTEELCDIETQNRDEIDCIMESLHGCRLVLCGHSSIAIAPRSAMEGDVLVVIEGSHVPCLIRPASEGTWTLVSGDCYTLSLDPLDQLEENGGCDANTAARLKDDLGEPEDFLLS